MGQQYYFEGERLGFAVGDHPGDEDFEVLEAQVAHAGDFPVQALEIFGHFEGDVADGMRPEGGLDFVERIYPGVIVPFGFVEFDVGQEVGDGVVEPGVDVGTFGGFVNLGEFGPA